jgi:hypothetical protein
VPSKLKIFKNNCSRKDVDLRRVLFTRVKDAWNWLRTIFYGEL